MKHFFYGEVNDVASHGENFQCTNPCNAIGILEAIHKTLTPYRGLYEPGSNSYLLMVLVGEDTESKTTGKLSESKVKHFF